MLTRRGRSVTTVAEIGKRSLGLSALAFGELLDELPRHRLQFKAIDDAANSRTLRFPRILAHIQYRVDCIMYLVSTVQISSEYLIIY